MYNTLFYLILGILVVEFVFDRLLDWLNASYRDKPIPKELQGIYDDEKYLKQQNYAKKNSRFELLSSVFSFVLLFIFLLLGGFGWLHYLLEPHINHALVLGLAFFGVLFLASDFIGIPFEWYHTFKIEQKFGFNTTTPKIFIGDKLKSYLITVVLGGLLYALLFTIYQKTQEMFWIYALAVIVIFMLFMTMFYSKLIVPLFNKQIPLPDGELKNEIENYANKTGFKISNIFEIDGSKRSTRANAYFTGLGTKKRIVLYDTLIKELNHDELVAVLAHEVGHYKKKHTLLGLFLSTAQVGLMLFILSRFITEPALAQALGVSQPVFHISLLAFSLIYSPVSTLTGLFMNWISRKHEYQADAFTRETHNSESLILALKKLATNNLSNLTPHPLYVKVNYSHPTLLERIRALRTGMFIKK
ncbi:MAG: peptidase M48 [Bacteroidetes bacterium HGW-Bacteroidetes-4]|jgi:STE24 endopeptidase|nr:MAG: peptidase M48 [Bacteroidetes bacterium HGW-Bacteroidetes-4]